MSFISIPKWSAYYPLPSHDQLSLRVVLCFYLHKLSSNLHCTEWTTYSKHQMKLRRDGLLIQPLTLIEYELLDRVKEAIRRSDKIRNRFSSLSLSLIFCC